MIRSMTGYGRPSRARRPAPLGRDPLGQPPLLRSLDARAQGGELFEDQIRQLIQDRFSRGKFNLTITWAGRGRRGRGAQAQRARSPTATWRC